MLAVAEGRLVGCSPDILGQEAWITGIEGKEGRAGVLWLKMDEKEGWLLADNKGKEGRGTIADNG